jgi:hypothetical protein
VRYYLIAYNVLSALGWSYVLLLTLVHLSNIDGQTSTTTSARPRTASFTLTRLFSSIPYLKSSGYVPASTVESRIPPYLLPLYHRATLTYARVGAQTAFVQTFAALEVLHVLLRWVRSPLKTTAMQVSSRLYVIWGITEQFDVVGIFASFFSVKLKHPRSTDAHQPYLRINGCCVVCHRSDSLFFLRLQSSRIRTLFPPLPSLHNILCPLSCRCAFRGLHHLLDPPKTIFHTKLVAMDAGYMETPRLFPRRDVCYLVAL